MSDRDKNSKLALGILGYLTDVVKEDIARRAAPPERPPPPTDSMAGTDPITDDSEVLAAFIARFLREVFGTNFKILAGRFSSTNFYQNTRDISDVNLGQCRLKNPPQLF